MFSFWVFLVTRRGLCATHRLVLSAQGRVVAAFPVPSRFPGSIQLQQKCQPPSLCELQVKTGKSPFVKKNHTNSPGQVAQLVGVLSRTPEGYGFNPHSGPVCEAANQSFFFSEYLSVMGALTTRSPSGHLCEPRDSTVSCGCRGRETSGASLSQSLIPVLPGEREAHPTLMRGPVATGHWGGDMGQQLQFLDRNVSQRSRAQMWWETPEQVTLGWLCRQVGREGRLGSPKCIVGAENTGAVFEGERRSDPGWRVSGRLWPWGLGCVCRTEMPASFPGLCVRERETGDQTSSGGRSRERAPVFTPRWLGSFWYAGWRMLGGSRSLQTAVLRSAL